MDRPTIASDNRSDGAGPGLSAEQRDDAIRALMNQIRKSVEVLQVMRLHSLGDGPVRLRRAGSTRVITRMAGG